MSGAGERDEFPRLVEAERPYLVRYANLQLRDRAAAEDAVQDTLLAALAAKQEFAARSSLRTWLTGILKHKIVDAIRRASREVAAADTASEDADDEFDALFDATGHWREPPQAWPDPDAALERKQFLAVLETCLAQLPERTARVFMMREHLGHATDEICKVFSIQPTHCWVLLHRARMALRLCLEARWFAGQRAGETTR